MKILIILVSAMLANYTFAGIGGQPGHSHAVDAQKAEELARKQIQVLIFQEKIDQSWAQASLGSSEIKNFESKKEWLLIFENNKGVKGKKLYIFLKLDGSFVAANFTGK